jgi:hypothetical protein
MNLGPGSAANSVRPGGIHLGTGGTGAVNDEEQVEFGVTFTDPLDLPADHYFFVPQVELSSGDFLWLSAAKPIGGPGTTPFSPDLQSWTRDAALDPDWMRVGTDIVGGATPPTFNAAFSLTGVLSPPRAWHAGAVGPWPDCARAVAPHQVPTVGAGVRNGRAAKAELLTGTEAASGGPVRRIVLRSG